MKFEVDLHQAYFAWKKSFELIFSFLYSFIVNNFFALKYLQDLLFYRSKCFCHSCSLCRLIYMCFCLFPWNVCVFFFYVKGIWIECEFWLGTGFSVKWKYFHLFISSQLNLLKFHATSEPIYTFPFALSTFTFLLFHCKRFRNTNFMFNICFRLTLMN